MRTRARRSQPIFFARTCWRSWSLLPAGIFLGETGALGFKARATLRLIRFPEHHRYATFSFADAAAVRSELAEIGREGVAADCYAWDPFAVRQFAQRGVAIKQGLKYLAGAVGSGSSIFGGIKDAMRIAVAGNRFAESAIWIRIVRPSDSFRICGCRIYTTRCRKRSLAAIPWRNSSIEFKVVPMRPHIICPGL
jgi:hypothetical protein